MNHKSHSTLFFIHWQKVLCEGWCHMLQKLSGRRVNPGLQMFGQSISGNVDMDGNGYAGTGHTSFDEVLSKHLGKIK